MPRCLAAVQVQQTLSRLPDSVAAMALWHGHLRRPWPPSGNPVGTGLVRHRFRRLRLCHAHRISGCCVRRRASAPRRHRHRLAIVRDLYDGRRHSALMSHVAITFALARRRSRCGSAAGCPSWFGWRSVFVFRPCSRWYWRSQLALAAGNAGAGKTAIAASCLSCPHWESADHPQLLWWHRPPSPSILRFIYVLSAPVS